MEDREYLEKVVTVLSRGIGVRTYRDVNTLGRTAAFLSDEFRSFGYAVIEQPFLYNGTTYYNLTAELTGTISPERLLIIGAHYDSVRTTPGADDNASGVAGLLALARSLVRSSFAKTVRFTAFALEEPPVYRTKNMASYHYARSLKEKGEQVEGMICLEMIGYFSDRAGSQHYPLPFFKLKYPSVGDFVAMVGNRRSKPFTERVAADFRQEVTLPVITLNAPAIVVGIDFSDHWSFNKFGCNALMVTDTAFYRNPHYHAPTDLPETLDFSRMAMVVRGLAVAVTSWGGTGTEE